MICHEQCCQTESLKKKKNFIDTQFKYNPTPWTSNLYTKEIVFHTNPNSSLQMHLQSAVFKPEDGASDLEHDQLFYFCLDVFKKNKK